MQDSKIQFISSHEDQHEVRVTMCSGSTVTEVVEEFARFMIAAGFHDKGIARALLYQGEEMLEDGSDE